MDAYSISYTSASRRNSSRMYQDLRTIRLNSIVELDPCQLRKALTAMDGNNLVSTHEANSQPHVGVIGAGLAGLRCADVLLRYGFRVTILEARDRLGGRVLQTALPNGHLVDVGPNWIHGTSDNPMLDLARRTGTTIGSWDTRGHVVADDGTLFPIEEGEYYSEVMWDIVLEAFEYSNRYSAEIGPDESLYEFFERRVVDVIPETEEGFARKREVVLQMADLWGAFVGSAITRQSLKFFWMEECIEGENLFCAGTYQKILEAVAKPATDGAEIRYRKTVTRIDSKSAADGAVRVTTKGGECFEFDEVVLTTPLGWLKQNRAAFNPPLPTRIHQAIDSMGYGCLEKVYISFYKAYWLVPGADGRILQGFGQWLAPSYALDTNPERWTHEVVELASLSPMTAHPTLLFYIYGDESRHLTSRLVALGDDKKKRDAFLYDFFRPYYSRLPGYDAASPDCRPAGCFATDWLHDDLAGNGSYTNFQVGLREGDKDVRAMREGVPAEGLWLAGEHTAPFVALGTATGAYWSGESVARRVAEAYGMGSGKEDTRVDGRL